MMLLPDFLPFFLLYLWESMFFHVLLSRNIFDHPIMVGRFTHVIPVYGTALILNHCSLLQGIGTSSNI